MTDKVAKKWCQDCCNWVLDDDEYDYCNMCTIKHNLMNSINNLFDDELRIDMDVACPMIKKDSKILSKIILTRILENTEEIFNEYCFCKRA